MIKLFGWEPRVKQQLFEKRVDELAYVRKIKILHCITGYVTYAAFTVYCVDSEGCIYRHMIPVVNLIATYATFVRYPVEATRKRTYANLPLQTLVQKGQLTGAQSYRVPQS